MCTTVSEYIVTGVCMYLLQSVAAPAHTSITIQRQQAQAAGAITIAVNNAQSTRFRSPPTEMRHRSLSPGLASASSPASGSQPPAAPFVASSSHQPAMFDNLSLPPTPTPSALSQQPGASPSPTPISFVPSQPIGSSSSWGQMMTPGEVKELLASQPQTGEFYVVIKGRRPGVYLSW
jgi:hypothetical protein